MYIYSLHFLFNLILKWFFDYFCRHQPTSHGRENDNIDYLKFIIDDILRKRNIIISTSKEDANDWFCAIY